jgi:hypothetical protein
MRRTVMAVALAAILAGTVLAVGGVAFADPGDDNGALVISDLGCNLVDGNGLPAFADASHLVVTQNGNGVWVCKADVAAASDGNAAHFDQDSKLPGKRTRICVVRSKLPLSFTADWWKETVSASGNATLTCHINPANQT